MDRKPDLSANAAPKRRSAPTLARDVPWSANAPADRLLRLVEVSAITGLSRPSIYRAISDGRFPRPVKFGSASRWSAQEVAEHIERLKAARAGNGSRR